MKLSIITVNYNNREGLQRTIDSVVSQTFRDFEWIVIDGGSTDGSKELIKQYADHFSYWVSEPDKGIYNAMNKGILKATGEYIMFLNSGDQLLTDCTLSESFSKKWNEDILYGDALYNFTSGKWKYKTPATITANYLINNGTILHSGGSFIKRQLFIDYGVYDENLRIVADWKFFIQAIVCGTATTKHLNITLSLYDVTGISTTNQKLVQQEHDLVLAQMFSPPIISSFQQLSYLEKENKQMLKEQLSIQALSKAPFRKLLRALLLKIKYKIFLKSEI